MNPWVKRKWVRALKSGAYPKGKNALGTPSVEFCCLGVLACEMVPEFVRLTQYNRIAVGTEWNNASLLPDDLAIQWGLSGWYQEVLSNINDRSDTFEPVIEWIEENL